MGTIDIRRTPQSAIQVQALACPTEGQPLPRRELANMIRMHVGNIIVGVGPIPSAIVLHPAPRGETEGDQTTPESETMTQDPLDEMEDERNKALTTLPINVGMIESACIGACIDGVERTRPLTHELLVSTIEAMGGTLDSVSIVRVEGTTFYATLDVTCAGEQHHIDARPSDAIAVALRAEAPILVAPDVLERAGEPNFEAVEAMERKRELDEFHAFVEELSPEDFKISDSQN